MPNLAKKFGPNTETFKNTQLSTSSPMAYGSDYVDERRFSVSDSAYDDMNASTLYPFQDYETYYGFNVGKFNLDRAKRDLYEYRYSFSWTTNSNSYSTGFPFDACVTRTPLISNTGQYQNFNASSNANKAHNGGDYNRVKTRYNNVNDWCWQREQGYIVTARTYTTVQDRTLRTANDFAMDITIYGVPYLAPIRDSSMNYVGDPNTFGYNFNDPYDDADTVLSNFDFTNDATRYWPRMQTKYGNTIEPGDKPYEDDGFKHLDVLYTYTFTGSDFGTQDGSYYYPDLVRDVRFTKESPYTSRNRIPTQIQVLCMNNKVFSINLNQSNFRLYDPRYGTVNTPDQTYYRINGIQTTYTVETLPTKYSQATPTHLAYGLEWSRCGWYLFLLSRARNADDDDNDIVLECYEVPTRSDRWTYNSFTQVGEQFYCQYTAGHGFTGKLNIDPTWQAASYEENRLKGTVPYANTPDFPSDTKLKFSFCLSTTFVPKAGFTKQSSPSGVFLFCEAENAGEFFTGYEYHEKDFMSTNEYRGITGNQWETTDVQTQNAQILAHSRFLYHYGTERAYEHAEVRKCLFSSAINDVFGDLDPNNYRAFNYFIEQATLPSNIEIESDGTVNTDSTSFYMQKSGDLLDPELNYLTPVTDFPSHYCGLWTPDGRRYIYIAAGTDSTVCNINTTFGSTSTSGTQITGTSFALYQVICTTPFDLSTANPDNAYKVELQDCFWDQSIAATNYDDPNTPNTKGFAHSFYSRDDADNYTNTSCVDLTNKGWRYPYKLKWVASEGYNPNDNTIVEYDHGLAIGILWWANLSDSLTYTTRIGRPQQGMANTDFRDWYAGGVYTEIGLVPGINTDPFNILGKEVNFVFDGKVPKQINFGSLLYGFNSTEQGNARVTRWDDDVTPYTKMYYDEDLGYTSISFTGHTTADATNFTNFFEVMDMEFYEGGKKLLVLLHKYSKSRTERNTSYGSGTLGYWDTRGVKFGSCNGYEVWCRIDLGDKPYQIGNAYNQTTLTGYPGNPMNVNHGSTPATGFYTFTSHLNSSRWSYLRQTSTPSSFLLSNSGRTMVRATQEGFLQSISRPYKDWVNDYITYPEIKTGTELPQKIARGGGFWPPYSMSKNPRVNTGLAKRKYDINPAAGNNYTYGQSTSPSEFFASAMASDGDILVYRDNTTDSNTVKVLDYSSGISSPTLEHTFGPSTSTGELSLGHSIAINSDYIAIGDPGYNSGTGQVLVYNRSDYSLAYTINMNQSEYIANTSNYGFSVAMDDSILVVGAPSFIDYDATVPEYFLDCGLVEAWDLSDGSHIYTKINEGNPYDRTDSYYDRDNDQFGWAVALGGNGLLYVGAPGTYSGSGSFYNASAGYIYTFRASNGDPALRDVTANSPGIGPLGFDANERWGSVIAAENDLVASIDKVETSSYRPDKLRGRIGLYKLDYTLGGRWDTVDVSTITGPNSGFPAESKDGNDWYNAHTNTEFGYSFSIKNGYLAASEAGSFYDASLTVGPGKGAFHIFKIIEFDSQIQVQLVASVNKVNDSLVTNDRFGEFVSISSNKCFVGSPDCYYNATNRGILSAYNLSEITSTYDTVDLTDTGVLIVPDTLNLQEIANSNTSNPSYGKYGPLQVVLEPSGRRPLYIVFNTTNNADNPPYKPTQGIPYNTSAQDYAIFQANYKKQGWTK